MAWEERNGRLYYYRKHRDGRKVISDYIGSGDLAEMSFKIDTLRRIQRKCNQQIWQETIAEVRELESTVDQMNEMVKTMLHGNLLVSGHHTHKGQWRRRRDEQ